MDSTSSPICKIVKMLNNRINNTEKMISVTVFLEISLIKNKKQSHKNKTSRYQ